MGSSTLVGAFETIKELGELTPDEEQSEACEIG
jgi:hypothetical protein